MKEGEPMICNKCKMRVATIRISQVANNSVVDVFLCHDCAQENAIAGMQAAVMGLSNMMPGFFSYSGEVSKYMKAKAAPSRCTLCGKTFEEIQQDGRLGCAMCYSDFKDKLNPIIERIYGSARHKGKCPSNMPDEYKNAREIDDLKALLDEAIKLEEYERAAEIRDSIKSVEQRQNG